MSVVTALHMKLLSKQGQWQSPIMRLLSLGVFLVYSQQDNGLLSGALLILGGGEGGADYLSYIILLTLLLLFCDTSPYALGFSLLCSQIPSPSTHLPYIILIVY